LNSAVEILSALSKRVVERLTESWENVSEEHKKKFDNMKLMMSPELNYVNLREKMSKLPRGCPFLPYFGLLLKDLTTLEEIPTYYPANKALINWPKMRKLSIIFQDIFYVQSHPWSFDPLPPNWVKEHLISDNLVILDENEQFKFSRLCEKQNV